MVSTGLSFAFLRFLVVDEADRLLAQSYQEWLPTLLKATHKQHAMDVAGRWRLSTLGQGQDDLGSRVMALSTVQPSSYLQKLLFSATLNHDPQQLASLNLVLPRLFQASSRRHGEADDTAEAVAEDFAKYSVPPSLTEHLIISSADFKPLVLLHFLVSRNFHRVLIFTASLEATHRLYLLLHLYGGLAVEEFSSSLSKTQRKQMIDKFNSGTAPVSSHVSYFLTTFPFI